MPIEAAAARISQFVKDKFPLAAKRGLSDDTPLLASGIVDSMGILEIVGFLEQEFSLQISDEDLTPENFASVNCLAAFVAQRIRPQARVH